MSKMTAISPADRIAASARNAHNGPDRIHRVIDSLCERARVYAPLVADQTLGAGATNPRPTSGHRKMLAWDLVELAHELDAISDNEELVARWFDGEPLDAIV